jgi:membrane-associated PAP2 superfamily phosphatase
MSETENRNKWIDEFTSGEISRDDLSRFVSLIDNDMLLRLEVKLDQDLSTLLFIPGVLDLIEKLNRVRNNKIHRTRTLRNLLMAASFLLLLASGITF